mgnify:CR=1 FL=1
MTVMRTRQAVIEALSDEMESDPNVFLMGEDIGSGGPFKATEGLIEKFGPSGIVSSIQALMVSLNTLQSGHIYHYLFLFSFAILLLIFFSIFFFSFFSIIIVFFLCFVLFCI